MIAKIKQFCDRFEILILTQLILKMGIVYVRFIKKALVHHVYHRLSPCFSFVIINLV